MTATREKLLECLPRFEDRWILVSKKQDVGDIINEILEAHKEFAPYYDDIALFFDGNTTEQICSNIYSFLKKNIAYREEKEEDQTTATPAGLLTRGYGDCKHYSSFSGGVLNALSRLTGKRINWAYRFASYDPFSKMPHHVFVVVKDPSGGEIWIDPTPGSMTSSPVWQIDKKINVSSMALRRNIAGIGSPVSSLDQTIFTSELPVYVNEEVDPLLQAQKDEEAADQEVTPELQNALEVLLHYQVMNENGEVSDKVLKQLSYSLPEGEFEEVSNARQLLQGYIINAVDADNNSIGSIFSTLWRGIKKVAAVAPRNAYLSLVALNVFGLATKLHNSIYKADGTYFQPNQDKLYTKWRSFGGDWHSIQIAIASGYKKKAVLGSTNAVGVLPAAVAAWVAVGGAIIAAVNPLIKDMLAAKQQAGQLPATINPATGLPYDMNQPQPSPTGVPDPINIIEWVKLHPLESAAIGAGAYYFLFNKSTKVI